MTRNVHPSVVEERSGERELVSPELVLVDPVLAERERARLAASVEPVVPRRLLVVDTTGRTDAVSPPAARPRARASGLGWRPLVVVGALTALTLLLLDVRVQVGERSALADASDVPSVSPPVQQPSPRPQRPVAAGSRAGPSERRFAWAPVAGALRYHVEFFRGNTRVFSGESTRPEITIPARWKSNGNARSFREGQYRWYVWSVGPGGREQRAIVQTTLTIPRS
jgi:hypothetical protein